MSGRVRLYGDETRPVRVVEDPCSIENPALAYFLDLWRSRCGPLGVPEKRDFGPKEFGPRLPWLVLLEALSDYSDFRYRVLGARVGDYFTSCRTGMTVREAFADIDPPTGDFVLRILKKACDTRKPIRVSGPAFSLNNVYCPDYDTLYLPFSSDGTRCDLVLDAFVFNPAELKGSRDAKLRLSLA